MRSFLYVVSILVFAFTRAAHADPKIWVHDESRNLGRLDVATGGFEFVGKTPLVMSDIAFDASGTLYGVNFNSGGGSCSLWIINTNDATTTLVGSTGVFLNALVFSRDGTLYAAGRDRLYTLDVATGAATLKGSFQNVGDSAGDLAFDAAGNLYVSTDEDLLVKLNPANGQGTTVGDLGFSEVFGLAFGPDGVMYGLANSARDLFSIDLTTGQGTFIRDFFQTNLVGAYGSSFFEEARPTTTTTTTLPENCTNCADDDGDDLTDFEDPSCCTATNGLTLRRASLQAAKKGNRLELETQLTGSGLETIDPTKQDLHVQIRAQSGELLCARIPATAFKKKKKVWQFVDRRLTTADAKGIDGSVVRLLKGQKLQLRVQGKKKVELLGPVPGAGTMTVTAAFRDANGHRCATATKPFRAVGKKATLRFP